MQDAMKVFVYFELKGDGIDMELLYSLFSKCSCFCARKGDKIYTYDEFGDKQAHTRRSDFFQARLEYRTSADDAPFDHILCEFLNYYFGPESTLSALVSQHEARLRCVVHTDGQPCHIILRQGTMRKLLDAGLDAGFTVQPPDACRD